jgi:hypothetical protein
MSPTLEINTIGGKVRAKAAFLGSSTSAALASIRFRTLEGASLNTSFTSSEMLSAATSQQSLIRSMALFVKVKNVSCCEQVCGNGDKSRQRHFVAGTQKKLDTLQWYITLQTKWYKTVTKC